MPFIGKATSIKKEKKKIHFVQNPFGVRRSPSTQWLPWRQRSVVWLSDEFKPTISKEFHFPLTAGVYKSCYRDKIKQGSILTSVEDKLDVFCR